MHSTIFLCLAGIQVAVTILLTMVPSTSAIPSGTVGRRDLPDGWSFIGCYMDSLTQPPLTAAWHMDPYMTPKSCVQYCNDQNYLYAGAEDGKVCRRGNVLTPGSSTTSSSSCSSTCFGTPFQNCGGAFSLDIYQNGISTPHQPTAVENVGSWYHLGCFSDANHARTLSYHASTTGGPYELSVEDCTSACRDANYGMAGMEFASQCWCGDAIQNGGHMIDPSKCDLPCTGDSNELCGGANSLNLYTNLEYSRSS